MSHKRKHIHSKIRALRKKKKFFQRPLFWIFLLIVIIVAGATYLAVFSPMVQIESIEISGNQKMAGDKLYALVENAIHKKFGLLFFNLNSKSTFLADTGKISRGFLQEFPEIESVVVQKKWFHRLTVAVRERQPVAVLCDTLTHSINSGQAGSVRAGRCFYIDGHGVVFETLKNPEAGLAVLTLPAVNQQIAAGQHLVEEGVMIAFLQIQKSLRDNFQISIEKVLAQNPLVITTSEKWEVHVNPAMDVPTQIAKLKALLDSKINTSVRKTLRYIYLQYGDRAYYK